MAVPVLSRNLSAWNDTHPSQFARKRDVEEALVLGIVYGEARALMSKLQTDGGGQAHELLKLIGELTQKAQELVPGVDLGRL